MPDLQFEVRDAEVNPYSEAPLLVFKLGITNLTKERIHSMMLRCQIMIEATRRHYSAQEQGRLLELFGQPDQWGKNLRSTLWTNTTVVVPSFADSAVVDMPVPCTFDFNVAATKYFAGLEQGEVPLCLLFSGTVFYAGATGSLQVGQIPWDKEANYRLAVKVWQDMMEAFYPNSAWLRLPRDLFDRLQEFKVRRGLGTWERALDALLGMAEPS